MTPRNPSIAALFLTLFAVACAHDDHGVSSMSAPVEPAGPTLDGERLYEVHWTRDTTSGGPHSIQADLRIDGDGEEVAFHWKVGVSPACGLILGHSSRDRQESTSLGDDRLIGCFRDVGQEGGIDQFLCRARLVLEVLDKLLAPLLRKPERMAEPLEITSDIESMRLESPRNPVAPEECTKTCALRRTVSLVDASFTATIPAPIRSRAPESPVLPPRSPIAGFLFPTRYCSVCASKRPPAPPIQTDVSQAPFVESEFSFRESDYSS